MVSDPKLTSSILDLSRNVDKLTLELKKNSFASKQEMNRTDASDSISEIAEAIKGSDLSQAFEKFESISKGFKEIDFSGLTKQLAQLDFKELSQSLKNFKPLDVSQKGLNNLASQTLKDLKTSIIGGLEKGGPVSKTGNYIVGEKGPEIVKLKSGDKVVPNSQSLNQELIKVLSETKKTGNESIKNKPSAEEITRKRMEILIENPEYADDPAELEREVKDFISRYGRETFTREDVSKLGKPIKSSEITPPPVPNPSSSVEIPQKLSITSAQFPFKTPQTNQVPPAISNETKLAKTATAIENQGLKTIRKEDNTEGKPAVKFTDKLSKLGKLLGPISNPKKNQDSGNLIADGTSNLDSGFGVASKKNALSRVGDFLKPTMQKSIPKITSESKISKELGSLAKGAEPSRAIDEPKNMFGGMIEKMEEVFSKKIASPQSSIATELPNKNQESNSPESQSKSSLSGDDINQMKSALLRIASLLEGPLSVTPLDFPFRPDSRRV